MFGNKRFRVARPVIKKEDLNKAILRANDRMKAETDNMQKALKNSKDEFKSVKSEIKQAGIELKNATAKIDSRISECDAAESQLFSLKNDVSSLTNKFKKELDIEESLRSSVDNLAKKENKLIKSIALLDSNKGNIKDIKSELKSAKQEYDQVKKDLLQVRSDAENATKDMKALKISKDIIQGEYDQTCNKLGELKAQANSEIRNLEIILSEKKEYFESETTRLDQLIADRIEELSDNTELSNRKLREYETILSRVMLSEKKIAQAEIQAKQVIANKEIQIEKIKEKFKTWKLTQLDQVAKMKLKGKIENIDKVGLKDILDV